MRISKSITSLIGGVSQQPAPLRLINQGEKQINLKSSVVNGLQSRAPINLFVEMTQTDPLFESIDRDKTNPYTLVMSQDAIQIIDKDGHVSNVELSVAAREYLTLPAGERPCKCYKTLTLADCTFILNTTKVTKMTEDNSPSWTNQALVFIKSVNYATTWTLTLNGTSQSFGYGGSNTTDGTSCKHYVNGVETGTSTGLSTTEVAEGLGAGGSTVSTIVDYVQVDKPPTQVEIDDSGEHTRRITYYIGTGLYYKDRNGNYVAAPDLTRTYPLYRHVERTAGTPSNFNDFEFIQSKSTLWIRRKDRGPFQIGIADTRGDSCCTLTTSKIQKFSDLPTIAPDGYTVRVAGDIATNADDYYVKFNANRFGEFSKGVWEETVCPNIPVTINSATMPWLLVHRTTGWALEQFSWTNRNVGDEDSNPIPKFINSTIKQIFIYRNRLCFLSQDILCMSAAADHGRFWNETATTLSDADPIYISASSDKLAELFDFGLMQESLIVFGKEQQSILESTDVLSPKTASLLPLTAEAYDPSTGLITIGNRIYFGYKYDKHYRCNELAINNVTGLKEAQPITSHVPNLIPYTNDVFVTGSASVNEVVVRTSDEPNSLYIYQYYISNGSKLQASWFKYTFENSIIKGIFFRDNILWIYMLINNKPYITSLNMQDKHITKETFDICVDYAQKLTSAEKTKIWTVPAFMRGNNLIAVCRIKNNLPNINEITKNNGETIELKTECTEITLGTVYKREYEFTTQYAVKGDGDGKTAITSGRWQLQKMRITFGLSGDFDVLIKPTFNDNAIGYKYRHSGINVGQQGAILATLPMNEGIFSVPLRGKNTDLKMVIESTSILPESFISAEIEGNYIIKVKEL